nr:MAG TPA: hypothetical protein [Caudoviricetes sp.]
MIFFEIYRKVLTDMRIIERKIDYTVRDFRFKIDIELCFRSN